MRLVSIWKFTDVSFKGRLITHRFVLEGTERDIRGDSRSTGRLEGSDGGGDGDDGDDDDVGSLLLFRARRAFGPFVF